MKVPRHQLRLERLMLALYLAALIGLLMLPMSGASSRFFNMGGDKLVHVALFGGLSILLGWNFSGTRNADVYAIVVAISLVIVTELAQGLVAYRSPELWDAAAGAFGAILGAVGMNRALKSGSYEKFVGPVIVVLGLMIAFLFVVADLIGLGANNYFGPVQAAGTGVGALIVAGGVWVYVKSQRERSQHKITRI